MLVTIKIEHEPVARRTPTSIESAPELLIQSKGRNTLEAIEKALRLLHSERDSLITSKTTSSASDDNDDEDEDF